jgi:SAM-dependent methyltransferase
MTQDRYIFEDTAAEPELERLRAIEALFDPGTQRLLSSTGAWKGRRCLEVGAGAGSIAAWMQSQVGSAGRVVAVDTNVRFLQKLPPAVEVVHGDVREAPLEPETFDVAHIRYVLIHNADCAALLDRVIGALKPGGCLLVEEPDFAIARSFAGLPEMVRAFERVNDAIGAMFSDRGLDPSLGRRVPAMLQERSLELTAVECDSSIERGGSPLARMMSMSAAQLSEKYVGTGRASPDDVAGYRAFASDPSCWGIFYSTVRALGTKRVAQSTV